MDKTLVVVRRIFLSVFALALPYESFAQTSTNFDNTGSNTGDFYMAIMSDPQIDWRCEYCSDSGGPLSSKKGGTKSNEKHSKSIQELVDQVGHNKFAGIIINGDITAFGWQDEFTKFDELYTAPFNKRKINIYPGLGNHDIQNNLDDCGSDALSPGVHPDKTRNHCTHRSILFLSEAVSALVRIGYEISFDFETSNNYANSTVHRNIHRSLAYSWDIGKVHFVQLNNYPAFSFDATYGYRSGIHSFDMEIWNSFDWLEKDLEKAADRGALIVINFHDLTLGKRNSSSFRADGYTTNTKDEKSRGLFYSAASHTRPTIDLWGVSSNTIEVAFVRDYEWISHDAGSGADDDVSFWQPTPPPGFHRVGDHAKDGHLAPSLMTMVVKEKQAGMLQSPTGYTHIWSDSGSGSDKDFSIWRPNCPAGFAALGDVAQDTHLEPDTSRVKCVKKTALTKADPGGVIWNDAGSGANDNFGCWGIGKYTKKPWSWEGRRDMEKFIEILGKYSKRIAGIFVGHLHSYLGIKDYLMVGNDLIPIIYSGSAQYNHYLKVRFRSDPDNSWRVNICKIDSRDGSVKQLDATKGSGNPSAGVTIDNGCYEVARSWLLPPSNFRIGSN